MKETTNKKIKILKLTIEDLAYGAKGVARVDDFVWFVKNAIPGQKVEARIIKKKKSYGEANITQVIEPSPHQVKPPCSYFGTCGGCQLQHLEYSVQVDCKTKQIEDILQRLGNFDKVPLLPTIPAKEIYHYRNKMEFTFSDKRWIMDGEETGKPKNFALGLHIPRRFDKVLDIDECMIQTQKAKGILQNVKAIALESGLKPYNIRTHEGFWRFLVIRDGKNTDSLMLNFFTSGQDKEKGKEAIEEIAHKLFRKHPEITSVLHTITDQKSQAALSDSYRLILGPEKITEKIGSKIFEISPTAFFQTNSHQAEVLFKTIAKLAKFKGSETVYDLYCGTGAIGIFIASQVNKVLGIEVIPSAIEDAKRNVELNNINNIQFYLADMKDALKEITPVFDQYGKPDVIILDPPRGGTHPKTIAGLLQLESPKIIYVSCNPAILARDLQILCESKYTLNVVQPIDMFPHTGHIEVVAILNKK